MPKPKKQPEEKRFKPTNLCTVYAEERIYYKDLPTGRCFADKECRTPINEDEPTKEV